jgi:Glycosyl hydrolases family 16
MSKEDLVQSARSLTVRVAAALAALAIAPSVASAAPGTVTDDSVADFSAGTPGPGMQIVAAGSVQLQRTTVREEFAGTTLPAGMTSTPWATGGGATVSGGELLVNGALVEIQEARPAGQVLQFRGSFSGAAFQHVGFGTTFNEGPWAMFSTNAGGTALWARTATSPTATSVNFEVPGVDATAVHTYRIEWDTTQVRYYVDEALVHTEPATIATPMRALVSDFETGAGSVTLQWVDRSLYPASSAFESRVFDSGKAATDWTTLSATSAGDVTFATRSGDTVSPNASWSPWTAVPGGVIASPSSRYIQYRALLDSGAAQTTTPTLDSVAIAYETDDVAPAVTIGGVEVTGATARVSFSSAATDVARFECSLDGGAFATCASPREYTGLAAGSHTVAVRAVDRAANTGATISQGFTVPDVTPPDVRVTVKVVRVTAKGLVKLRLSCPADETHCRVTVQLKLGTRVLARKTLTIPGGKQRTFTLELRRSTLRRLIRNDRLRITVRVTARDAANNANVNSKRITLKEPKRR